MSATGVSDTAVPEVTPSGQLTRVTTSDQAVEQKVEVTRTKHSRIGEAKATATGFV